MCSQIINVIVRLIQKKKRKMKKLLRMKNKTHVVSHKYFYISGKMMENEGKKSRSCRFDGLRNEQSKQVIGNDDDDQ